MKWYCLCILKVSSCSGASGTETYWTISSDSCSFLPEWEADHYYGINALCELQWMSWHSQTTHLYLCWCIRSDQVQSAGGRCCTGRGPHLPGQPLWGQQGLAAPPAAEDQTGRPPPHSEASQQCVASFVRLCAHVCLSVILVCEWDYECQ